MADTQGSEPAGAGARPAFVAAGEGLSFRNLRRTELTTLHADFSRRLEDAVLRVYPWRTRRPG
ncbi:hypothetical protein [Propylenella binzhouense]|uniref:Uncharacterized protein n=1 Tax=Propylenella binzhouense TaxID=2555902 RepID=A0A964T5D1_9HYPH|nr:hypothetical protein [Propylenella binzhouense]MYZ48826.1 hypothetical protein [Propylenella binzhouense]